VGPQLAHRIGVVPYAVKWRAAVGAALVARRQDRPGAGEPLVASFGIVDPSKRPEILVEAVAVLATRGVHVQAALVGPVSTALGETLGSLAVSLGVADRVTLTGEVPEAEYLRLLGQATVAVQLRDRFSGECSGTVSECLTLGIPTAVASIGWMAEIPATAALAVPPTCGADALADALAGLLSTASRREAVGQAGRRWAEQRTFEAAAAAVLEDLEASAAQRPWRRASAS
jgi:glycosyltransferase involved in cell wall biosynthesis